MQPAQECGKNSAGIQRDSSILLLLQNLSRLLDMSSSAKIAEVRISLQGLIDSGRIRPPTAASLNLENFSLSAALRRIALEERLDSPQQVMDRLPSKHIERKLTHLLQHQDAPQLVSMTPYELSQYISQQIMHHAGISEPRSKSSSLKNRK